MINFLDATPDNEQYYVMEIMHKMGWDIVNIINLSNTRDVSYKKFKLEVYKFRSEYGHTGDIHSKFDDKRNDIDSNIFLDSPIIAAQGRGNSRKLDNKAVKYFKENDNNLIGKKNAV